MAYYYDDGRTVYRTTDGQTFSTERSAREHQDKTDGTWVKNHEIAMQAGEAAGKRIAQEFINEHLPMVKRVIELEKIASSTDNKLEAANSYKEIIEIITCAEWSLHAEAIRNFDVKYNPWAKEVSHIEEELSHFCLHGQKNFFSSAMSKSMAKDYNGALQDQYFAIKCAAILDLCNTGGPKMLENNIQCLGSSFAWRGKTFLDNGDTAKTNADYQRAIHFEENPAQIEFYKGKGIDLSSFKATSETLNTHAQEELEAGNYEVAVYLWQKAANMGDTTAKQKIANAKKQVSISTSPHDKKGSQALSSYSTAARASSFSSSAQQQTSSYSTHSAASAPKKKSNLLRNIIIAVIVIIVLYNAVPLVSGIFGNRNSSASQTTAGTTETQRAQPTDFSDFVGTWKRDNFNNTLTFTENTLQSSSQGYSWSFVSASGNRYSIRGSAAGTNVSLNMSLVNGNIEISGDSGSSENNWNGTWKKQ